VIFEITEAVITSFDHELLTTLILLDGLCVAQDFIAGLHHEQITVRRDALGFESNKISQVLLGKLILRTGVEIGLGANVPAEQIVRAHGWIEKNCRQCVLLAQPSGVVTAKRAADECHISGAMFPDEPVEERDGVSGPVRQIRAEEIAKSPAFYHALAQQSRLERKRRAVEAVNVDQHAEVSCAIELINATDPLAKRIESPRSCAAYEPSPSVFANASSIMSLSRAPIKDSPMGHPFSFPNGRLI
jgi:hypothetical protein